MKLSDLIQAIEPVEIHGATAQGSRQRGQRKSGPGNGPHDCLSADPDIGSIHYRAQQVRAGGLFIAVRGLAADGHNFIAQAVERGAAAIVTEKAVKTKTVVVQVADSRRALANIAARFYSDPSEKMVLVGITGTNGKTTCAFLIESILAQAGLNPGVIGTINCRYGGKVFDSPITTPESLDLQKILADMLHAGVTHVVMEASSHAIDLNRIRNCWFDVGVFTNLSQDHLDYHGDMTSYWSAKKRFFTDFLNRGPKKQRCKAVINCEDPRGRELAAALPMPVIKTGTAHDSGVRAEMLRCDLNGIRGKLTMNGVTFEFTSRLVGEHNLENILCAAGVAAALGLSPDIVKSGIRALTSIPGRLERIENNSGRFVYVDYAHTPDALENVLSALGKIAAARIICVFGCGGDRDQKKRPVMGEIAARLSDLAVITSDNPRTEAPLAIIDQIMAGVRRVKAAAYLPKELGTGFNRKGYVVEADRRRAIRLGIQAARAGDTVLIAGKGHETYQIIGRKRSAFDDREEARKALGTSIIMNY